ncbi:MAG TPA: protein kinase [Ktedonobacterales bacterium]|nr:protein kinase [Ktedonobacterales bacterium]
MAAQSHNLFTNVWLGERYLLKEQRAQGTLCTVYRGEDTVLRRPVAVKVVPEWLHDHYHAALRATATLVHPVAITPYDAIEQDNMLFLIQEYILAQPLSAYLHEGVPIRRALDLVAQIARALAYAHRRDILHGDLTPAATLIDRRATVRVNNFGLPPDETYFAAMAQAITRSQRLDQANRANRANYPDQPAPSEAPAPPANETAGETPETSPGMPSDAASDTPDTPDTPGVPTEIPNIVTAPTVSAITPVAWGHGLPAGDVWAAGVLLWLMVTEPTAPDEDAPRAFRLEAPEAVRTLTRRLITPTHDQRIADADTLVIALEDVAHELAQARPQKPTALPSALVKAREEAAREAERAARVALGGVRRDWSPDAPTDPLPLEQFDAGATRAATDFEIVSVRSEYRAEPYAPVLPGGPGAPIGPRLRLPSRPISDPAQGIPALGGRPHSANSAPTAPDHPAWAASAHAGLQSPAEYAKSDLVDVGDVGAQPYRPYAPYEAYPAQRAGVIPKPPDRQGWGLGAWLMIGLLLFVVCFVLGYFMPPITSWLH